MKQDNIQSKVDKGWDKMYTTLDRKMPQKKERKGIFWWTLGTGILAALILIALTYTMTRESNQTNNVDIQFVESNIIIPNSSEPSSNNNATKALNEIVDDNDISIENIINNKNVTATYEEKNKITQKSLNIQREKSTAFDSNLANEFSQQSENKQIPNNNYENINEHSGAYNILNTGGKRYEVSKNPIDIAHRNNIAFPLDSLYVLDNLIAYDNHHTIENPTIQSPTYIRINSNKKSPFATNFSFGMGTDYLHNGKAFGLSPSLGFNITKRRLSIGASISYTRTFNVNSESVSLDGLLAIAEMDFDLMGGFRAVEIMAIGQPHYISSGINLQYSLGYKVSIIVGMGREFHLGKQEFISSPEPFSLLDLNDESFVINHRDNYYIESGISYNFTSQLSLEGRYRYVSNSYLEITEDNTDSAKASLTLRYLL